METRRASSLVLAVPTLLLTLASPAIAWQEKVDASVLDQALVGGEVEVLIYLAEQADLSAAAQLATKEEKGAYVYGQLTSTAAATQPAVLAELALLGVEHRAFWIVNTIWARGGLGLVQAMALRPDVAFVYESGTGFLELPGGTESVAASALAAEWNIEQVRANEVWELGITGQGVTVAGADTGVEWTHPALKNQYRGWDGANADHDYNWHLGANPNTECPEFPSTEPCDDDALLGGGHGTHTVGTMVGDDGAGNRIGMAPGARWIACRNMNFGVGTVPSYLDCMQWFLAPTDVSGGNPDPSKAPHVVNNSWGCVEGCPPPILKAQLESSRAAGLFYAVSAGNDGSDCSTLAFPLAIYEAAFSVGATNANDQIAGFSSRGPILTDVPNPPRVGPDISAPGVGVRSALKGGRYGSLNGTSMAGPHVAGLAALIISANPALAGDVDRIEEIIMNSAVHLTTEEGCGDDTPDSVPNNSYGWGRIDALAAVLEAIGDALRAVDDRAATRQGTAVTIDVLANDLAPAGATLTVTGLTQPANGTAVDNGDGTVTYTPDPAFASPPDDSFTYTVSDGTASDTATVSVTVVANQAPAAADDAAATDTRTAVTIDVLANDSDPEGDPLIVGSVGQPAHGTAATDGATVTYTPDGSFVGSDVFSYQACDPGGLCDPAQVTVEVHCPAPATGSFSDDFEPGAEPGWQVDTAANDLPTSLTWTVVIDPFAHSATNSFTSDATSLDFKDDRVVAPAQDLSATSRLAFWHRFSFEGGFDGGVLEVSNDGGATWVDVVAGGGAFLEGGYNGQISPSFGSPIAGREAWTGDSESAVGMSRVEVDLGAFAGLGVLVRWRLALDPLVPGSLPGLGWWIDDVAFTNTLEIPESCPLPPLAVDDTAVTDRDVPVTIAVLANDSDPNGEALTLESVQSPTDQGGTAVANPDGTVTYTPPAGFVGVDTFTYTVSDGDLFDSATVTVFVEDPGSTGKVTGGGWIPDGAGGKSSFGFNAHGDAAPPKGRLSYHDQSAGIHVKGRVEAVSLASASVAEASGSCDVNGAPCRFSIRVEDNGEPGTGVDRFAIRVTDLLGTVLYQADGVLGGGNVQIH